MERTLRLCAVLLPASRRKHRSKKFIEDKDSNDDPFNMSRLIFAQDGALRGMSDDADELHMKDAKLIEAINEAKGFRSRTRRNWLSEADQTLSSIIAGLLCRTREEITEACMLKVPRRLASPFRSLCSAAPTR